MSLLFKVNVVNRIPYRHQAAATHMSVNLSGTAAAMSQQLLYVPDIEAAFVQVGGVTVPQSMYSYLLFNA